MAHSSSSAARSAPRRAPNTYAPPTPLQDLHILDLLELTGSQAKAGAALAMHQSTVCRSLQLMREQFRLKAHREAKVCRHGSNESLHYLRLSYRAHRVMAGMLRIGTDALHQPLLGGWGGLQPIPPQFRSARYWADLVAHALLDGALVSSFCHEQALPPDCVPRWEGVSTVPLGELPLQLVSTESHCRRVLLPRQSVTPLLHQALAWHGFAIELQPAACQEPAAWLKRMRDRKLAIPLCSGLDDPAWMQQQGLKRLSDQPPLLEQLWLLLPAGPSGDTPVARQCIRQLRSRIGRCSAMGATTPIRSQG